MANIPDKIMPLALDLTIKNIVPRYEVISQSINTNYLLVTLTNDFIPINLTGCIIQVAYEKPDDTRVINRSDESNGPITITDAISGIISIKMTTQAIAVAGKLDIEISILDEDEKSIFPRFSVRVRENIDSDNAVTSINEVPILQDKINQTNATIATANTAIGTINTTNTNMHMWEEFDINKTYKPLNKVLYNGNSYVCLSESIGIYPSLDITKWKLISVSGRDGFASIKTSIFTANVNNVTNIPIGFVDYDPIHDTLKVIYLKYNTQLIEGENYTVSSDNLSINLIDDSLTIGEKLEFDLYKEINEEQLQAVNQTTYDGGAISDITTMQGNIRILKDRYNNNFFPLGYAPAVKTVAGTTVQDEINKIGVLTGLDNTNVGDELRSHKAQLADIAPTPIQNLRIMLHFHYENHQDKLALVKQLGFNTITYSIIRSGNDPIQDTIKQLDLFAKVGVYAILGVDANTLLGTNYASEQNIIAGLETHPVVIGFTGIDEPVYNHTPKVDQETIYNRIKAVTKKTVFLVDTSPTVANLTNYYTEKAFDVYLLDLYYNSGTLDQNSPALIISSISQYVMLLKNTTGIVPPKQIIPILPLFADGYFHEPTLTEFKAHIDGWRPFFNGAYAVFGFDNLLGLVSSLDSSDNLRKMATIIPSYFASDPQDTPKNWLQTINHWADVIFNKGLKIVKPRSSGIGLEIEGMNSGHIRVRPLDDTNLDSAMIYGTNADTSVNNFIITNAGRGIFNGGLTLGLGNTVKKWSFASGTLNFGTIPANSSVDVNVAKAGVLLGDSLYATPYGNIPIGLTWTAYTKVNDSIVVRVLNITGSPITFSGFFTVDVVHH